ncbi:HNH endonuclease [Chloroflexota bacterium]
MRNSGTYMDNNGYLRFNDSNKLFHRWAMEKKLLRPLEKGEIVHHINENKLDNKPENLELITAKEHYKKHVVPILEARREAQIMERLAPIQEAQTIRAICISFALAGAGLFITGLIMRIMVALWYEGLAFLIAGLGGWFIHWFIQKRQKRNES